MKKLTATLGVAGFGVSAIIAGGSISQAADHRDSTMLAMAASSAADINDVYAWMSADAADLNLVMTVQPFAAAGATFSSNVQYVLHVHSGASFGAADTETQIICELASATSAQCWVGDQAYVAGDPSDEAGLVNAAGNLRVFAGQRNDPFFFNLDGFDAVVDTVKSVAADLTFDAANCPELDAKTSAALVGQLGANAPGNDGALDDFAGANVVALVIQVDKALVTGGGPILAVWASTHTRP